MGRTETKKIVVFGAGKIGRSFIGQLFSLGGYEVVFVDISRSLTDALNRRRGYRVVIKSEKEQVLNIENVRAVILSDEKKVIDEVVSADIVATSVGIGGLNGIFPVLAKALLKRYADFPGEPLDIIIAENMRNADIFFREKLTALLPQDYPFSSHVGLVETSIGKMVPIMHAKDMEDDMLQIFAEPYNTLILNRKGFISNVPDIRGLAPKDNMKAWVDRKLFIHNLGHSASAYIGYKYNPELTSLWEVLAVPDILSFVRKTMLQSAEILLSEYPGESTRRSLMEHIDDLLFRFQNKALGDTIFRVGCDLKRKLGHEDRLAGAVHKAFAEGLPYDRILFALVCGCYFRAADEQKKMLPDDINFMNMYGGDVKSILSAVCRFDRIIHKEMIDEACSMDNMIRISGVLASMKSFTRKKRKKHMIWRNQ